MKYVGMDLAALTDDVAGQICSAAEDVRRDALQALNAVLLVPIAEARLADLERRTRATGTRGYLVEISELTEALGKLRAALAATAGIVAFRAPARRYAPTPELVAEMADTFGPDAVPNVTERGAVVVVRVGQVVVRRAGRARVEDGYAVHVGSTVVGVYPKRLAVKFGVHAMHMDSAGAWPFWAYLRGRKLSRYRYLRRRAVRPGATWRQLGAYAGFAMRTKLEIRAVGGFVSDLEPSK